MDNLSRELKNTISSLQHYGERLQAEIDFACHLASHREDKKAEWEKLINQAVTEIKEGFKQGTNLDSLVERAETILAPIGQVAKEYTLHYVGHAHLDMNWLWGWPETVEEMYRTFSTMDRLMDEFPDFRFSQSSAVDYATVEDYSPGLFDRVRKRVQEGRWDVTASTWVEGDKNMASGEALVRQILYAKRYFIRALGLNPDSIKIDWAPDTFGHPWTYPQVMRGAGVDYYYFNRGGKEHRLFWWEAPDGSRVLAWNDGTYLIPGHDQKSSVRYHRQISAEDALEVIEHQRRTGMKDYIIVYGVGDHGGGPTRRHLEKIKELSGWPIFPKVKLSTAHQFFSIAREHADNLPVVKDELNFPFPGCYTSQSRIKFANRRMEDNLPVSETLALITHKLTGFPYPKDKFEEAWRKLCFNQFHDILPGSGIIDTREHALGLFQEVEAFTTAIREQALDAVASKANTEGEGIPVLVFNPSMWERTDRAEVVIYDPPEDVKEFVVVDEEGRKFPFQIYGSSEELRDRIKKEGSPFFIRPIRLFFDAHNRHEFIQGTFTAEKIPPFGYKIFWLRENSDSTETQFVESGNEKFSCDIKVNQKDNRATLENEFYRLEIDGKSGALTSLYDKVQGKEFVPRDEKAGLLSIWQEAPHAMSAWDIGPISHCDDLDTGGRIRIKEEGPVRGIVQYENSYHESKFILDIILQKGVPEVRFKLEVDWLERGSPETGVPSLKVIFPLNMESPRAVFDVPFGNIQRPVDGREVPTQRWADVHDTQGKTGITFVNDHTYGCSVDENVLRFTLLRSSYDPDPLPETGKHIITYSLFPHDEDWNPGHSSRRGSEFNTLFMSRCVGSHSGDVSSGSFVSVEPAGVAVSCFKLSEDADEVILRLNEVNGKECTARVKMPWRITEAQEVDLLERPVKGEGSNISIDDAGNLQVKMTPYKVCTICLQLES